MTNLKTFWSLKANIHVIRNPEDSKEESQEDRTDVPEAKEKPKGQSKEKEKWKRKQEGKKVEVPLIWQKKASPHPKRQCNFSAEVTHPFPDSHTPFDVFWKRVQN